MLNAILCVWNEEDIIGACVANAFAHGCDRVFILDNASTDRTVQRAIRAGAVYHATFATDEFDEIQKTVYINKCVAGITEQLPDETTWWLYLDADEFPDCNTGKTIRETLAALPPDVRAFGSDVCNHLPTHPPYLLPGFHPADFMPVGTLEAGPESYKFTLLRHDKDKSPIYSRTGAHTYASESPVREAEERIIIHHFNYRQPDATRARMAALILPDARGKRRVAWYDRLSRTDGLERSPYHDRFERLDQFYADNRLGNLKTDTLPYAYPELVRWYDPRDIDLGNTPLSDADRFIWEATRAFFLGNRPLALARYEDALRASEDFEVRRLLTERIERCKAAR